MPTFRFGFSSGESSRFPRDLLTPQATSIPTEVVIKTIKLAQVTPEVNPKAKAEDAELIAEEEREIKEEGITSSDQKTEVLTETEF